MSKFISLTCQAVAQDDINAFDACYALSAHLISSKHSDYPAIEAEIQVQVQRIVDTVVDGRMAPDVAADHLIALKDDLSTVVSQHS